MSPFPRRWRWRGFLLNRRGKGLVFGSAGCDRHGGEGGKLSDMLVGMILTGI